MKDDYVTVGECHMRCVKYISEGLQQSYSQLQLLKNKFRDA